MLTKRSFQTKGHYLQLRPSLKFIRISLNYRERLNNDTHWSVSRGTKTTATGPHLVFVVVVVVFVSFEQFWSKSSAKFSQMHSTIRLMYESLATAMRIRATITLRERSMAAGFTIHWKIYEILLHAVTWFAMWLEYIYEQRSGLCFSFFCIVFLFGCHW